MNMIRVGQRLIRRYSMSSIVEVSSIDANNVRLNVLKDDSKMIGRNIGEVFISMELYPNLDWDNYNGNWYLLVGQDKPTV